VPIETFVHASGIRVHAGQQGLLYQNVGKIRVSKASIHGVDQNLWAILKIVVDELAFTINVNSIDTGQHIPNSRHASGRAVDINRVGAVTETPGQATLANAAAMRLVRLLRAHGFHVGEGAPPRPGLLFGPVHTPLNPTGIDHAMHLHMSIPR
jgi:hypothetical protein